MRCENAIIMGHNQHRGKHWPVLGIASLKGAYVCSIEVVPSGELGSRHEIFQEVYTSTGMLLSESDT